MSKRYNIRVTSEKLSILVQERLFALGYRWSSTDATPKHTDANYIQLWADGDLTYAMGVKETKNPIPWLTIEDLFDPAKEEEIRNYPAIRVGDYNVTDFDEKGFRVGCQKITWETYDAIGKRRPKSQ